MSQVLLAHYIGLHRRERMLYTKTPTDLNGDSDPSQSDRQLTTTLVNALQLIDCQMLDHLVIGVEGIVSFSEKNWI